MRKSVLLFFLVIVVLLVSVLGVQIYLVAQQHKPVSRVSSWSAEQKKEYATMLLAKGLLGEAADAFEEYAHDQNISAKEMAQASYRLGMVCMDLFEYERALKAFYRAEILAPNAGFVGEMDKRIVEALENVGMSSQAQYELEARTSLEKTDTKQGTPVARIGDDIITSADIDESMKQIPEWMRASFEDDEGRARYVQEYVTKEILYRKAKRAGIEKRGEVRKALSEFKKQIVVQQLLKDEIEAKITISDSDVELYYQAHKNNYQDPAGIKVAYLACEDPVKLDETVAALKEGKGTEAPGWVTMKQSYVVGVGDIADAVSALSAKDVGDCSELVTIGDADYVFLVKDKKNRQDRSFAEVKEQVRREYTLEKQKELTQQLLQRAFEEQEVEIYVVQKQKTDENSDDKNGEQQKNEEEK